MDLSDIVLLVLGWLLGLLSPVIVDAIKHRREAEHGRRAVVHELKDLALVLALASFKSAQASGQASRAYLEWLVARIDELADKADYREFLESTRGMLAYSDEQIAAAYHVAASSAQSMPMLQNYSAPLLDSRIAALWTFDTEFQRKLFSIRRNLSLLDGNVAQIKDYFRMTFDEPSSGNRRIIEKNMIQLYGSYTERAKMIVDHVRELPGVWSNNSFKPKPLRSSA